MPPDPKRWRNEKAMNFNHVGTLVGKFFHSFKDERVEWQGRIVAEIAQGCFLAQMFSWLDGRLTEERVFQIKDVLEWRFYSDQEEWIEHGDQLCRKGVN